jgi:predicted metal-dependent phosphoesterase TrpH
MIIDLHFHTKQHSPCSQIDFEAGIAHAKAIGLDGICITDHDTFADRRFAKAMQEKYGIFVCVATEILTLEGDILCFGLDQIPEGVIASQTLIDHVNAIGGACIAAHPYRENMRGLGDHLLSIHGLHAVETLNGNTKDVNNRKASETAERMHCPKCGGSDAHRINRIGIYATEFLDPVASEDDLIACIRSGHIKPVSLTSDGFR